jgi:hypothetical protein
LDVIDVRVLWGVKVGEGGRWVFFGEDALKLLDEDLGFGLGVAEKRSILFQWCYSYVVLAPTFYVAPEGFDVVFLKAFVNSVIYVVGLSFTK